MAHAVGAVDAQHEQPHGGAEGGVDNELVAGNDHEQVHDEQLERHAEEVEGGVDADALVGHDDGGVGCLRDAYGRRHHRQLVDPACGRHAVGGNVELVFKHPEAHGLAEDEDEHGEAYVDEERCGEYLHGS